MIHSSSMQETFSSWLLFWLLLLLRPLQPTLPVLLPNIPLLTTCTSLPEIFLFSIFPNWFRSILGELYYLGYSVFLFFSPLYYILFFTLVFSFLSYRFRIFTFNFFLILLCSTFSSCHVLVFVTMLILWILVTYLL